MNKLAPSLALLCAWNAPARAVTPDEARPFSGFGTLGAARSSTGKAGFLRDLSQPRGVLDAINGSLDTRLGLQFQARLNERLTGTLQVVSKYRYDTTFKPEVTWAFLGWNPAADLQVRTGRLGFDVFMNADSRDIGYSFLWVRPPAEYYGTLPISHLDGLDAAQSLALGEAGTLRLKAYAGLASEKLPAQGGPPLDLTGSRLAGCVVEWQTEDWRSRVAYATLHLRHDLGEPVAGLQAGLRQFSQAAQDPAPALAAEALGLNGRNVDYWSGGAAYEPGDLQAQAMVARFRSEAPLFPDSWSGVLSVGYRFGRVVPYLVGSRIVTERPSLDLGSLASIPSPAFQALVAGVNGVLAFNVNDQTTLAAGLRWDLAPQAAFKIQADRVRTHASAGLWRAVQPGWNGRATVVTVVLNFVF